MTQHNHFSKVNISYKLFYRTHIYVGHFHLHLFIPTSYTSFHSLIFSFRVCKEIIYVQVSSSIKSIQPSIFFQLILLQLWPSCRHVIVILLSGLVGSRVFQLAKIFERKCKSNRKVKASPPRPVNCHSTQEDQM